MFIVDADPDEDVLSVSSGVSSNSDDSSIESDTTIHTNTDPDELEEDEGVQRKRPISRFAEPGEGDDLTDSSEEEEEACEFPSDDGQVESCLKQDVDKNHSASSGVGVSFDTSNKENVFVSNQYVSSAT